MSVTFYSNYIQYAGFAAATEPTVTGETFTNSGGETSGATYDLLDNRRTNVVTLDTNGQSTTIQLRVDATNSHTNNFSIIDNHNLNTAGALFDIEQGGTNITLSNSYSGSLRSELSTDSAAGTPDADGITLTTFSSVTDTQWEYELDTDNGNYNADITVGEMFFGFSKSPANNPELQSIFSYDLPGSSYRESDGGQRYGFGTHTNIRRGWRLTWKYMSDTNKTDLEFVFNVTAGVKRPFYIDLSGPLGNTNPTLYFVRFMKPLSFTQITQDAWQVIVEIEEEI